MCLSKKSGLNWSLSLTLLIATVVEAGRPARGRDEDSSLGGAEDVGDRSPI